MSKVVLCLFQKILHATSASAGRGSLMYLKDRKYKVSSGTLEHFICFNCITDSKILHANNVLKGEEA